MRSGIRFLAVPIVANTRQSSQTSPASAQILPRRAS